MLIVLLIIATTLALVPAMVVISNVNSTWHNSAHTPAMAFTPDYCDSADSNGWVGVDFQSPQTIRQITFSPRPGYAPRLSGGRFQISDNPDFDPATTIYTIGSSPTLQTITLSPAVRARYIRYLSPPGSHCNISNLKFTTTSPPPPTGPTLYVSPDGDDAHDGQSPATAVRTPRIVDQTTTILAPGIYPLTTPIDCSGHFNFSIGGDPTLPPPTLTTSVPGGLLIKMWTDTHNYAIHDLTLDSALDHNQIPIGVGIRVRGSYPTIHNVNLRNLFEGITADHTDHLTLTGGIQIGQVVGRCIYLLDVHGIRWTGGHWGPASRQSPIRFSSPGVVGIPATTPTAADSGWDYISGVNVTQATSKFKIACWAIHAARNLRFLDCVSDSGEFSLDSAGEGLNDIASYLTITNLRAINTKVKIGAIAQHVTFQNPTLHNPSGELVSALCLPNSHNMIDGGTYTGDDKAVMFYCPSDLTIWNGVLRTKNPAAVFLAGDSTPANGSGNSVVPLTP